MAKSIVFITGGNNGLGYYATQQLAATGNYHVIIGSRSLSKAQEAIKSLAADSSLPVDASNLSPCQIDVTSDESIAAAVQTVASTHGHIDILMANAGIAQPQTAAADGSGPSIRQIYHTHFDTNLFGAVATLETFLPLLRKSTVAGGKRIAFTSSGLASLDLAKERDTAYAAANYVVYRSTKTAMSMVLLHYTQTLEKEGFVVSASDPGYCATNLNDHNGLKDPRDGAKELIKAAVAPKEKVHGLTVGDYGVMAW